MYVKREKLKLKCVYVDNFYNEEKEKHI